MKLTVLGATGRTGVHLIDRALAAGHEVTAAVRSPGAITKQHPRLRVVVAEVTAVGSMVNALRDADAVCTVLGSTAPRKATMLYSASIAAVLEAMKQTGVRRIVGVTAIPAEPDEQKTFMERHVVHRLLHVFFGGGYEDMVRMEQLLRESELDWTIVRPPRLTDSQAREKYRKAIETRLSRAGKIPRSDLALAVLDTVSDSSLIGRAITVAS
jgi:putative NADH-flavin reductase